LFLLSASSCCCWFDIRCSVLGKIIEYPSFCFTMLLASYVLYVCTCCSYDNLLGQMWGWCTLEPGLNHKWQIVLPLTVPRRKPLGFSLSLIVLGLKSLVRLPFSRHAFFIDNNWVRVKKCWANVSKNESNKSKRTGFRIPLVLWFLLDGSRPHFYKYELSTKRTFDLAL
jgi:hypothetical protein